MINATLTPLHYSTPGREVSYGESEIQFFHPPHRKESISMMLDLETHNHIVILTILKQSEYRQRTQLEREYSLNLKGCQPSLVVSIRPAL